MVTEKLSVIVRAWQLSHYPYKTGLTVLDFDLQKHHIVS